MAGISTHILDTARGKPAALVPVHLERLVNGAWATLGRGETDSDGRNRALMGVEPLVAGHYRLTFDTGAYFATLGEPGFYPIVQVMFDITDATQHYHVPLLLSPFGYSTYRGS